MEDFAPRTEDERYRIYVLEPPDDRRTRNLLLIATAADMTAVGTALGALDEDEVTAGNAEGLSCRGNVGVLDGLERRWIVKPFPHGDHL